MRRREFVAMFGAAAWSYAARAQQPDQIRRIGILMNRAADSPEGQARIAVIQQRLQQLGWSEGQNLRTEIRWGGPDDPDLERKGAEELVALAPEVVLAGGTLGVTAMLRASRTIPVVFAGVADPVGLGVVTSMAHPGGSATGVMSYEYSLAGKWLELLKQVAPGVKRALVLRSTAPNGIAQFAAIQSVAPSIGIEVRPGDLRDPEEVERAVSAFARAEDSGLVVTASGQAATQTKGIVTLAARYKLPAVYAFRDMAVAGGLISYGPDWLDQYRVGAEYVDRILKGAKPADLPVQVPRKYELVINLKTAKALGLTVPAPLLAQADEVIE